MLSYTKWKSLHESYDRTLGVTDPETSEILSSFQELLEAKKKAMKKKMDFDNKDMDDKKPDDDFDDDSDDDDLENDAEKEDDAETGDGEVVDAASPKDKDSDDEDHDEDDGEDIGDDDHEEENPTLMKMKKMKKKMKAKCCADKSKKKCSKKMKSENSDFGTFANEIDPNSTFWKSLNNMMHVNHKHFDGVNLSGKGMSEDSLIPAIDPNYGLVVQDEKPISDSI